MLNSKELKEILKKIYNLDDVFIVPLTNWYVPDCDFEKLKSETYIGYRILEKRHENGSSRIRFRLAFSGENAEKFCDDTSNWANNIEIQNHFAGYSYRVLSPYELFSYSGKQEEINRFLTWFTDIEAVEVSTDNSITRDEMNILFYIENYIDNFLEENGFLTASEVRKWPKVAEMEVAKTANFSELRARFNAKVEALNLYTLICKAMKAVKNRIPVYTEQDDGTENFKVQYKSPKKRWSD